VRVLLAAPQNGTPEWVPGGGVSLACALRCWAFVHFGALEEMRLRACLQPATKAGSNK
jgi:hypothetical protein